MGIGAESFDAHKSSRRQGNPLRKVHAKLHSSEGASLSVALLFFIVCAVVGSVILAAASSSMGRMKNLRETDREREMLSSAARLVVDKLSEEKLFDSSNVTKAYAPGEGSTDTGYAVSVDNNSNLTSTSEFVYYRTADRNWYWSKATGATLNVTDDSSMDAPESEENTPSTSGGGVGSNAWTWETWPLTPQGGSWPTTIPEKTLTDEQPSTYTISNASTLKDYRNARAFDIISYYWGTGPGKSGSTYTKSRYLLRDWTRDALPGNESWLYELRQDATKAALPISSPADDPGNAIFRKQPLVITVGDKTDNKDKVHVDLYMDQFFDIQAQIYPVSKDYYQGLSADNEATFAAAPMRYLVKIPAKTGEVRYEQTENTEDQAKKVASWTIKKYETITTTDPGTGKEVTTEKESTVEDEKDQVISQAAYDKLLNNTKYESSDKVKVRYETEITAVTDILKVTVTRKVILSDFGWDPKLAEIYTGASVEAAGYAEGDYLTAE